MMDKGEVLKHGFEVRPADNGGFVVLGLPDGRDPGRGRIIAALSTPDALVEWLRQEAIALRLETAPAGQAAALNPGAYDKKSVKDGEWLTP